ncbi:MAG: ribosome small subunit-dependent GTPase A [Kofleriaceae bacterium]|nr:ribosome small subunit-dependent GTPase A [Kofleriaceae bacterium]
MLKDLGWNDGWEEARRAVDAQAELSPLRIMAEHRGAYHATDGEHVAWVELTGRAYNRAQDKRALPTVGDWILAERWADAALGKGAGVIRHILPRRSFLVRKAAGEATQPQPVAANVDIGIVMTSANSDLSPARLDRYLGLLRDGGIAPALVLSKLDLVDDPDALLAKLRDVAPGAPVLAVSSITGAGLDAARALCGPGRTAVLLGSSGVGKSSLLNALLGEATQLTQPIREDDRGRHTTTRRQLFLTPYGLWIDTPGMRELAQWIEEGEEETTFEDIAALAEQCKFSDCKHRKEPGCAVRAAVEAGTLAPQRLASFHKLSDERATGAVKQQAARRLEETRRAKAKKYAPRPGKPEDDR